MNKDKKRIVLGVITGVHGVSGLLKVKSYTEPLEKLATIEWLVLAEQGKTVAAELLVKHRKKNLLICQLTGVNNRSLAEQLIGCQLVVEERDLPPLSGDSYYAANLVGRKLTNGEGKLLGEITSLENFGAGDLVAVALRDKTSIYLPFSKTIFLTIDADSAIVDEGELAKWL